MQKQHRNQPGADRADRTERTLRQWGANIERLRRREGRSQEELAGLLDPPVHQSTIARWEAGRVEPSLEHKLQLAEALGRPAATIFPLVAERVVVAVVAALAMVALTGCGTVDERSELVTAAPVEEATPFDVGSLALTTGDPSLALTSYGLEVQSSPSVQQRQAQVVQLSADLETLAADHPEAFAAFEAIPNVDEMEAMVEANPDFVAAYGELIIGNAAFLSTPVDEGSAFALTRTSIDIEER